LKRVPNDSLDYKEGVMHLDSEPFTGIGEIHDPSGGLIGEYEYREGVKWGKSRTWYTPGVLFQEGLHFMGTGHGMHREWYRGGRLKQEIVYELGYIVRRKRWSEDGKLTEDYRIQETESKYKSLEKFRKHYEDVLAREKPPLELD
jgi:antitoxin component YwqK of YwqJK toxin-antitoxin module